ncbi:MAG: Nif3-like dinuclear metal center hexameric protein [Kosmotogaceae bacterium]
MDQYKIESYFNEILHPEDFEDYCHNGIQIEGTSNIKKVAVGVSFNEAFVDKAVEENVDLLLVHHGIFGKDFFSLKGYFKNRVKKVLDLGMTLMGYHLPLDAHEKFGNNATIIKKLGLEPAERIEVGYTAGYSSPVTFEKFFNDLQKVIQNEQYKVYKNTDTVEKIFVLSGGGSELLEKLEGKVDTFVTGEVKEQIRDLAKETNINFINAGHYATETFGVKNLGKLLEEQFGLETIFIDVFNEI